MILNPQIAKAIKKTWFEDQAHPYRGREQREFPDENLFAKVLDTAFQVSLLSEEGNPVKGALTILSQDELANYEIPKRRSSELVIRFKTQRDLDHDVVAKLATVTEAGGSSLLVSSIKGTPKIWGLIYYEKPKSALSCIPVGLANFRSFAPDSPTIEIVGAGSLRIVREDSVIGRIEKGVFSPSVPTPFISFAMGNHLHRLFGINTVGRNVASEADGQKMFLIRCLEYLLFEIDKQGGGASLIFIPDSSIDKARELAKFPWESEGGLELYELINHRCDLSTQQKSILATVKTDELLRERLDALARLASLDGALLLTPDYVLLGFGVKLNGAEYQHRVQMGQDGNGACGGEMDFSRLGTRHNSALNYISSVPGAIGFVASEDGPIRGLAMATSGDIHCWPDCRLSKFR